MSFKEFCIQEGIVGGTAKAAGKAAYALGKTLTWDILLGVGAVVLADIFRDSPLLAAGLIYLPMQTYQNFKSVFQRKSNGKISFNADEFQKLDEESQKQVLAAIKQAMNRLRQEKPEEYNKAVQEVSDTLNSIKDPKQREKLGQIFKQIFQESNMATFKEFMDKNNGKKKADKLKAKAAELAADAEEAEAEVARDKAEKAKDAADKFEEAKSSKSKSQAYKKLNPRRKNRRNHTEDDPDFDENGVRIPKKHVSVYAGGNGKSKAIPYTQDQNMEHQAVGPMVDEDEDGDEIEDANPDPSKEKVSPHYSLQGLASESVDPTLSNGADAMYENHISNMNAGKSDWEKMESSMNSLQLNENCGPGGCAIGPRAHATGMGGGSIGSVGMAPMPAMGPGFQGVNRVAPPVADKSEIYAFIKNSDLHNTSREYAMRLLLDKYSNPQEELEQILDDAVMSNDEQQTAIMDQRYDYDDVMGFERPVDQMTHLTQAWAEMEDSDELRDL